MLYQERVVHDIELCEELRVFLHLHHEGSFLGPEMQLCLVDDEVHVFQHSSVCALLLCGLTTCSDVRYVTVTYCDELITRACTAQSQHVYRTNDIVALPLSKNNSCYLDVPISDPLRSYTVWIFSGVSNTLVMITKCTLRLKWYIFTLCIPACA